jgi:hypothetical protein
VIGGAIVCLALTRPPFSPRLTAQKVRSWIDREAPAGSTRADVAEFFAARRAPHSGPRGPSEFSDVDQSHRGTVTRGIIPERTFWFDGGVDVVFYLDRRDRVARYDVKQFVTWF